VRATGQHALRELAHHAADHLPLRARGAVDERAAGCLLAQVALALEHVHHRHHGGVGDPALLKQRLVHVAHRGGAARPHELHQLELLRRQGRAGLAHVY
jgi:hypothetical protein